MNRDQIGNGKQQMRILQAPRSKSIMVIAAHPDDIESWCAGTLVQAIDQKATLRLLLVTSGEHGSSDPSAMAHEIAARREEEVRRAAEILGITEVVFLHYPDGEVENTYMLRADLVEWIRRWQPSVLFTHDSEHPYPAYLSHRDHRSVGRAALDAVYPLARDHLAFPEQVHAGLRPHSVGEVWLFASTSATTYVDISSGFERKIAARLAHESQTVDPVALATSWYERSASLGEQVGLVLAEAFTILEIDE
ncbi:MAG: PIG-L family deacetylase [Chloroflexota bacterium]|nr:PIG-L family deacetylase [Chloroflexota bacterium]